MCFCFAMFIPAVAARKGKERKGKERKGKERKGVVKGGLWLSYGKGTREVGGDSLVCLCT